MPEYFPQLRPGVSAQYPLRKTLGFRTVMQPADAVTLLRSADDGWRQVQWTMQLRGLSDAEASAVETLFRNLRGAHGSFVFCDPEDNLLRHSESLPDAAWSKSAGVTINSAPTAPSVALAASRVQSPGGSTGELWQNAALPTGNHWLLSLYARADAATALTLYLRSSHGEQQRTVQLSTAWQRYWFGGSWWPAGEGIDAGVRLPVGAQADLSAFQLEGQASPSVYKRTQNTSGVYPQARFLDQRLRITTLAPDCHQMNLRIGAQLPG